MVYLSSFTFPSREEEYDFILAQKRTCYNSYYPFQILSKGQLPIFEFEPITILYGGNGSGKTTALNIIAEKLNLERDTLYNRSSFFEEYTSLCRYELECDISPDSRIITSDDVFDFMINLRAINNGISNKREELFEEYMDSKYSKFQMRSLEDYEQLKKVNASRSKTQSKYVKSNLVGEVSQHSNGESAFTYFSDKIKDNGLYLLDEPENSLSPEKQLELLSYLQDSTRFFGCQLIIATHSPFLLSIKGAKIYNMDADPVIVKKWTELPNVMTYYQFFKDHEKDFNK